MKTLIVDDEPNIREGLKILLQKLPIEVIGESGSVPDTLQSIKMLQPELVLLDIQLSDGSAFDVLDQLDEINFKLVFVTSYDQYAIKAFKYSAFDYLLKPIDPLELANTINRISTQLQSSQLQVDSLQNNQNLDKLIIRSNENIYTLRVTDIIRCQADGGYTHFYLADGKHILSSKTLKEYANLLPTRDFVRVHQSHLVNWNYVSSYEKKGILLLENSETIPVSVRKRSEVHARFVQ